MLAEESIHLYYKTRKIFLRPPNASPPPLYLLGHLGPARPTRTRLIDTRFSGKSLSNQGFVVHPSFRVSFNCRQGVIIIVVAHCIGVQFHGQVVGDA